MLDKSERKKYHQFDLNDKHGIIYVVSAKIEDNINYDVDRKNLEALSTMQAEVKIKPSLI